VLLGEVLSSIEGEFNSFVIGVEVGSVSDEVGSVSTISLVLLGEILSSIEGEFNSFVIGVEVGSVSDEVGSVSDEVGSVSDEVGSVSDEVGSVSTISVVLLGEMLSSIEGEFNSLVIGVEVVSFVPVKFTE
jgi:hypothetical protein